MSARTAITAALQAALPSGVVLLPYARQIDPPTSSTVMVRIDEVAPSRVAEGLQDYTFALVCIAAKTTAGPADDELDNLLEDVLLMVTKADGLTWSKATRATYDESNPAYEVTCVVTVNKE